MQTRPALLLVLVLALLATGCANRPNLSSGITTETVLSLPPDLEVPAGDTALLYPLSASPEGAKAQVEALVGQPLGEGEPGVSGTLYSLGQATVTIDQDTGYWTYETGQDIFSVDPSALPPPLSDAQAQAIALDYLQTHGLWSGPMASVGVGPITSGETGGDTILGKNVYCFPAVDGAPALFLPISRAKWGPPPGRRGNGALRPEAPEKPRPPVGYVVPAAPRRVGHGRHPPPRGVS